MTSTLLVLLCLGLHLGQRTQGSHFQPVIWMEPDSVIPKLGSVTIWCQGTSDAQKYKLCKEGTSRECKIGNESKFSIPSVTVNDAGRYRCYYYSPAGWSESSKPQELVVTGSFDKPSLTALPSAVAILGENVTLQCGSLGLGSFILTKGGGRVMSSTLNSHQGHEQGKFLLGPITQGHKGTYRCYEYDEEIPYVWSIPSDPLELLVSGNSKKPSLLTPQSTVLDEGENLTLQCHSDISYDGFIVVKDGQSDLTQHPAQKLQDGFFQASFPLGAVSHSHGGRYRCYGTCNLSVCSAPSETLDILITGWLPITPSLSVQPAPSGDGVILLCQSEGKVDTFLLIKEGAAHRPLQHLRSVFLVGRYQAEFSMSTANSSFGETYRCYSSRDSRPFLLSYPSEPVNIRTSGARRLESYQKVLIAVSLTFLVLILLFFLFQYRHQCKFRRAGLTSVVTSPEASSCHQKSPEDKGSQEVVYAQVKRSRQKRQQASCSSPEQLLDVKVGPAE